MKRYIDAEKMIEDTAAMKRVCDSILLDGVIKYIERHSTDNVTEVVRCRDCIFYDPAHVEGRNGERIEYGDGIEFPVAMEIGTNVGGQCAVDCDCGYLDDKTVFRAERDYCSRGKRKAQGDA